MNMTREGIRSLQSFVLQHAYADECVSIQNEARDLIHCDVGDDLREELGWLITFCDDRLSTL